MKESLFIPEQKTAHFKMRSLTVTVNRDLTALKNTLSKEDFEHFLYVYKQAEENPKKAFKELAALDICYPRHPEILNLMTYLYLARRKLRKAEKLIFENYHYNPEYLLAKINYADYCIRKGKIDEIPKIFDQKFDLCLIEQNRVTFHLIEYRGFMVVMSFYHLAINNKEAAEAYFYLAHTVDKSHPSVQLLKKKLYKKPFKLILKKPGMTSIR